MGGHRSYQRVTEDRVLMVPPGLAAGSATFCRLMGVSMSTLTTTAARPPAQVVVMGQGLVGHLAARIFARCGYHVAACDPSEVRRRIAEAAGIRALPSAPLGNPEFQDRVALVLECSGHEQGALDGCKLVRKKGEVVLIGTPWRQQTELSAHAITHAVFHRYVVLRSGWEWELPHQPADFRANSLFENYAAALRWLAAGEIDVEPLYSLVPPREAQRAYEELLGQRTERLAVVFDWTDCP
jgi:threonine dehydrogenase-like Zn-dependent dehydrogenase